METKREMRPCPSSRTPMGKIRILKEAGVAIILRSDIAKIQGVSHIS